MNRKEEIQMNEYAVVIKPDMTVYTQALDPDDILGSLQALAGGYIQTVPMRRLPPPHMMVVNEEVRLKDLPANLIASWLYGIGERICGTAVILTTGERDGEPDIVGLPGDLAAQCADCIRERFLEAIGNLEK